MVDYLKIARAAVADVSVTSKSAERSADGSTSAESPEIVVPPDPAELARASGVLYRAGVRIMRLEGVETIGVWSDLDGPEMRAALVTVGWDRLPVRYLDGAVVPMRYKTRRVEGEPVPLEVLAEMEQYPADPWTVRDRMLSEMCWRPRGVAWPAWQAAALNRLLRERGVHRKSDRIEGVANRAGKREASGISGTGA
jgi:hypothetical protein